LLTVENWTLVLLPVTFWNVHDHEVGAPVVVSLNLTATGAVPDVTFAVNEVVGAGIWLTLINTVWYDRLVAYGLLAFRTIE
jgi:hypothetical protein